MFSCDTYVRHRTTSFVFFLRQNSCTKNTGQIDSVRFVAHCQLWKYFPLMIMDFFNLHYLPANSFERNKNIELSNNDVRKNRKPISRRTRISSVDLFLFGFRLQKKNKKSVLSDNKVWTIIISTFFRRNSASDLYVCVCVIWEQIIEKKNNCPAN